MVVLHFNICPESLARLHLLNKIKNPLSFEKRGLGVILPWRTLMFEVGNLEKTVFPLYVRIFYVNSQKTGISQDKKASVAFLASVGSIASIKRERRDVRERREGTGKRHEDGKMRSRTGFQLSLE